MSYIVLQLTAYHLDTMAVAVAESVSDIASEALVLSSTLWNTYSAIKIARTSNHNASMMYLLLRDGEILFLHLTQEILSL